MDGPALEETDRNVERWREKIEVKLDNRQVFFLFFGSAVVACMLFVLGVMVGKRIESRGQAEAPQLQDPLAALDRAQKPPLGVAAPDPQLTFASTLAGGSKVKPGAAHASMGLPAKVVPPKPAPPKPVAAVAKPVAAAPKPIAAAPKPIAAVPKPIAATKPAPAPAAPADASKGRGKYTLQISTFTTSADAEAFVQKYPGAFMIAGDVPGKGMVYRVRFGNYATYKDVIAAKESFEKQHNMIALIAAR
jgi:septal ring-binding cell division protein DamX